MATPTKNPRTLVSAGTVNGVSSTTRGSADLRTAFGGLLTMKITNGATGPTAQCVGRILVAHTSGATPTPAAAGADWKTVFSFGGGISNNAVTERSFEVPDSAMHVAVEFSGNTGQSVTVEAYMSELTSIS